MPCRPEQRYLLDVVNLTKHLGLFQAEVCSELLKLVINNFVRQRISLRRRARLPNFLWLRNIWASFQLWHFLADLSHQLFSLVRIHFLILDLIAFFLNFSLVDYLRSNELRPKRLIFGFARFPWPPKSPTGAISASFMSWGRDWNWLLRRDIFIFRSCWLIHGYFEFALDILCLGWWSWYVRSHVSWSILLKF